MKRLAIFFFYDKDGVVDDYVLYFLRALQPFCSEICSVINGNLTEEGYNKLSAVSSPVLIRDNVGLDAFAYKYAIEHYGYTSLARYDEVLCCNFTCFGPLFNWKEMFQTMERKKCDWWSLYTCSMKPPYIEGEHLPSFFIVYRRNLIQNPAFKKYWDTLPAIKTYEDSVLFHEERQTPYFDAAGFTRKTYFDFSRYDTSSGGAYWPLIRADELIMKEHFPFLKRRNLFIQNGNFNFRLAQNVLTFIKKHSSYDIGLIYQNIVRTQDPKSLNVQRVSMLKRLRWKLLAAFHPKLLQRKKYQCKLEDANYNEQSFNDLFNR